MRKKIVLLIFMVLLLGALSTTDAEIVRDLEFYESLEALEDENLETVEAIVENHEAKKNENKEVADDK